MQKSVKIALAAVVVVILVGGAGFYWFFLRDDAPERAWLQTSSQAEEASDKTSADGTWKVQAGNDVFVGYRVSELFGGETIKVTAVGRTPGVEGTLTVSGSEVTAADITADMTQ